MRLTEEITGLDPLSGRPIHVTVDEGRISRIDQTKEDIDLYLSPGLVDLQVNGYAGFDCNADDLSVETICGLVDAMLQQGVTCFAPTLITAPEEKICKSLEVFAVARDRQSRVAECVPLVHVEGPHLSPQNGYRGAHSAEAIRPPSIGEFDRWQAASGGLVGIVTLSPHFDNSNEYIAELVERGVHVALGHTYATPEQIRAAVDAGASLSTHLGNGIALDMPRHRNVMWPQLADDRLSATFIADGHHLPSDVFTVMLRAKGIGHSILISDSVALAGMPAGIYSTPIGGKVELRTDGRLCMYGSELLAGSTASLSQCVGRAVQLTSASLHDALTMASTNPGRFMRGRGQLAVGSRADIVRFRWTGEVQVTDVWLAGERISQK